MPYLTMPRLCEQVVFDVSRWRQKRELILTEILDRFGEHSLAVRSSALNEDGSDHSMAGAYESVTGVRPAPLSVAEAVDRVIDSYRRVHDGDQVLVQPMVERVAISGVVVTRDLDTGGPYYVINYDDFSGRTDSVTSGAESKTILVNRSKPQALRSIRLRKLIEAAAEIELVTGCQELDIEFCITFEDDVYVLQVRRLTTQQRWERLADFKVDASLAQISQQLDSSMSRQNDLAGATTAFGEMPDWNPAEMIGNAPRPLALSLYKYLITDSAWCQARGQMGYQKLADQPLMTDLAGRPYIDVRRSLNSFLPGGLDRDIAERVIDFQISRLSEKREYHDKIEFQIAVTCRDFSFEDRANEMRGAGLDAATIGHLADKLQVLTAALLDEHRYGLHELYGRTDALARLRKATCTMAPRQRAVRLLETCIVRGIVPFAMLARHAFVAASMLQSMVSRDALSEDEASAFLRSIHTVTMDVVQAMHAVVIGKEPLHAFLDEYGHLRPGTYDILSWRYDEKPELYVGGSVRATHEEHSFVLTPRSHRAMGQLLTESGYQITPEELLSYITTATRLREAAKFEFTHNVSEALVALCEWGERVGLSREDLSYIPIELVLGANDPTALRDVIQDMREKHRITRTIRLPHLILAPDDVYVVRVPLGQPSYITNKIVTAPTRLLHTNERAEIDHHIVLIESADPGYDWIFSHQIHGLITKYGGANSHMAIRCAEFGLPAAIGCGERMFHQIASATAVELNGMSRTLRVVSH